MPFLLRFLVMTGFLVCAIIATYLRLPTIAIFSFYYFIRCSQLLDSDD